nr:hypothetical protein [Anaerolineae bacterium]NIN95716.1 hypothetical protein [Anaerolineae bacterium]
MDLKIKQAGDLVELPFHVDDRGVAVSFTHEVRYAIMEGKKVLEEGRTRFLSNLSV